MEAKLIKTPEQFYKLKFYNDEDMLACATALLSKQNCDEIFGVVDVDKLAEEEYPSGDDWTNEQSLVRKLAFKKGFNKVMELYQPTEIEVEIEMECLTSGSFQIIDFSTTPAKTTGKVDLACVEERPKLDSEGCLILKKK
jgi:hypothetical protein